VLVINDDIQVDSIISLCHSSYNELDKLKENRSTEDTVNYLRDLCEKILQLSSAARARAEELITEDHAKQLLGVINSIGEETSVMVLACKGCLLNPTSENSSNAKKASVEKLQSMCTEVEKILKYEAFSDHEDTVS
jgi:glycogen synthase